MQLPPVDVILSWPTPNYTDPSDIHGSAVILVICIFLPITAFIVGLRCYTRLFISRSFGADDFCLLGSVLATFTMGVMSCYVVEKRGWNRHVYDVPLPVLSDSLKIDIVIKIMFALTCVTVKFSMLFQTLRLMQACKFSRCIVYLLMTIEALNFVCFLTTTLTMCRPLSLYWTFSTAPQDCINETAQLLASGILNTVTDFCIILLPIPIILQLKLPRRQQIILILVFSGGIIVCVAGAVRTYYTYQMTSGYDKTWSGYNVILSGSIEMYIIIIGASVPPLKPLMSRYFPKLIGIYSAESSVFANQAEELSRMTPANFEMQMHPSAYSETTAGTPSPVPLDDKKKYALPVLRLPSFISGGSKPMAPPAKELQPIVSIFSTFPVTPSTVGNEKPTVTSPARATDMKRESYWLPRRWRQSAATSLSSFNVADREGWDGTGDRTKTSRNKK